MAVPKPLLFVTRDLTQWESLAQGASVKSKSGLLERIAMDGAKITITRRNGAVDELEQGAFCCTSYVTSARRRLFVIRTDDGRKIAFREMDGMLSPEDWDTIATDVLGAVPSNLANWVYRACMAALLGMLASAISVGLLAGMSGLDHDQTKFSSPLSLLLMAGWMVGLWFLFKRVRWWG